MSLVFRMPRYFYLIKQDTFYILIIKLLYNYYTYYIYIIIYVFNYTIFYIIFTISQYLYLFYLFIYFYCIFLWILFQESMCAWIPMSMSKRVGEREREREREIHHPVNSSRSELSYPPPTRKRERERESRYSQERRGEESARRRESLEKSAHLSCHQPVISSGLSAGEGRCADRSIFVSHIFSFGCSSAFLPWAEESFGGARAFGRGRMVNNLTECEEVEAAANSQGEWRNLWRSHPRSSAHTHPLTLTREWSIQMEGGFEPQVLLLLPTTGPLLSYCMAAVSGIVIGGCSCVCSCSEPHHGRGTSHYRHTVITPLVET